MVVYVPSRKLSFAVWLLLRVFPLRASCDFEMNSSEKYVRCMENPDATPGSSHVLVHLFGELPTNRGYLLPAFLPDKLPEPLRWLVEPNGPLASKETL